VPAEHDARPKPVKETTMQYMLMIYGNEAGMQSASKADAERMLAAYGAYTQAIKSAGVLVASGRLRPSTAASTVRGGYYLIEVPDLDAALSWAARCPGASHGTIEVRPIWTM
jgi:hypothetical protein